MATQLPNFSVLFWLTKILFFRNNANETDDIRNEPNYAEMKRPGSAGEKRKNIKNGFANHESYSDTELDNNELKLEPLQLEAS